MFVIVKLKYSVRANKEEDRYFVGQVVNVKKNEVEVKFMKRGNNNFHFPQVEDRMALQCDQVQCVLSYFSFKRGSLTIKEPNNRFVTYLK